MTEAEAKYILDKHTLLFNTWETNQSMPDRSHGAVQEIANAYKHFHPEFALDMACGSCAGNMLTEANRIRKELASKFYTFPKED